jgi:hypothetical protein
MRSGRTALAAQRTRTRADPRLVLISGPELPVPAWASAWCRATGYELVRPTVPNTGFEFGPQDDEGPRIAEDVGVLSGTGTTILVNRSAPGGGGGAERVVAAVQDLPADEPVLADAATCTRALRGSLQLVHCVPLSFAERSVGLDAAVTAGLTVLNAGLAYLNRRSDVSATARLLREWPHELAGEDLSASLLVVGGARTGHRLGLVALSALYHAPCSVLLTPRMARA